MIDYTAMDPRELRGCAALAARAFYDYEYFSLYLPEEARRQAFLDALLLCEFRANRAKPEVKFLTAREDGRLLAVAQLCSPAFRKPTNLCYLRCGWLGVLRWGGSGPVNAWNAMEKLASAPCHGLGGQNWYLSLLTVAREEEGRGIGSRFLQECLIPYVKKEGAEIFSLFTNSEGNRRFYEKNGFTEFDAQRFSYGKGSIGSWSYVMRF